MYVIIKDNKAILIDSKKQTALYIGVTRQTVINRLKNTNKAIIKGFEVYEISEHLKNKKRGKQIY